MDNYYKIFLNRQYIATIKAFGYDILDEFGTLMYKIKFFNNQYKYIAELDSYLWRPMVIKKEDECIDNIETFNVYIDKE